MKRSQCLTIAIALCGAVMAFSAPAALGQSPSVDGYDEVGASAIPPVDVTSPPAALGQVGSSSPGAATTPLAGPESNESGELAFTGFGLPLLALLGGTLLAAGVLARQRLGYRFP